MTSPSRDLAPDVLRGFALLGIIVVNVAFFATDVANGVTADALRTSADAAAAFLVHAFAQGKFYLVFAFLFGYATRYALRRGADAVPRWRGRSLALMVFGAAHAVLAFIGDILFVYGVLGLLLTPLLFRPPEVLRRRTRASFAVATVLLVGLVALLRLGEVQGADVATSVATPYGAAVQARDYLASIPPRATLWLQTLPFVLLLQGPLAFAAFLVGLRAARTHLLAGRGEAVAVRRWLVWGFGVGLPLQLASAGVWLANETSAGRLESVALGSTFAGFLTAPLLSAGYVAAVVALLRTRPAWVAWWAPAGRMALTTYLSQSVVLSLLFSGWGAGLYGRTPYAAAVAISVGVAVGLSLAAAALGRVTAKGPMERALGILARRLAFGRPAPTP
ncbi:MAG: DUF418 domain-containing protein [Trueperaceae bacterium]|nr:DUF418 domain-containing protein [Trueperaceae bacterium]